MRADSGNNRLSRPVDVLTLGGNVLASITPLDKDSSSLGRISSGVFALLTYHSAGIVQLNGLFLTCSHKGLPKGSLLVYKKAEIYTTRSQTSQTLDQPEKSLG